MVNATGYLVEGYRVREQPAALADGHCVVGREQDRAPLFWERWQRARGRRPRAGRELRAGRHFREECRGR